MQVQIFTLPLMPEAAEMEEMNHFLRAHKVIDVRKELVQVGGSAFWTFCVTYTQDAPSLSDARETKGKVDYRKVLDGESFDRFYIMRKVRKELAEKDAVPAYAVFTDAEMAEVAKAGDVISEALLASVPGIGKKKVEKYGAEFCKRYKEIADETGGKPDGEDSRL